MGDLILGNWCLNLIRNAEIVNDKMCHNYLKRVVVTSNILNMQHGK